MSTVDEYHKYARDCLRWAATAQTEEQRQRLLSLARDWTQAALGLEGVPVRSEPDWAWTKLTEAKRLAFGEHRSFPSI